MSGIAPPQFQFQFQVQPSTGCAGSTAGGCGAESAAGAAEAGVGS